MSFSTLTTFLSGVQGDLYYRDDPIPYADLVRESARVARGLRRLGLREGDRLALWLPNVPAWLSIFFACARLGATCVAVNTRFKSHELSDIVRRSRCRMLVYWPGFRGIDFDAIVDACEAGALESLETVIAYTEDDAEPEPTLGLPMVTYSSLRQEDPLLEDLGQPGGPCLMFTTSGTTKAPKFVVHGQGALVRHAMDAAERFGYREPDSKVLITVPLCGGFGFCNALAAIAAQKPLIMYPTFDAVEAAEAVIRHRVTHANATDEMFTPMLASRAEPVPFPSVRFFGYSSLSPASTDFPAMAESRGLKLVGLYGSSEMQGLLALQDESAALPGRVLGGGLLVSPDARVRARDPDSGQLLGHDLPGELEFKGPSMLLGYFENDDATAAAMTTDGWFRSGDLGYTRSERSFVFMSRLGDAFRLSGFMVSPAEIEEVLQSHPDVDAAQVVSAVTPAGLKAVAFVIPSANARFDEAALLGHCSARMARFKVPVLIAALEGFPTTASANGRRIQKARLREQAQLLVDESAHDAVGLPASGT